MTYKSIKTIGADTAVADHGADGNGIVWAIVDSGIDGSHDHFKKHKNLELPSPLRHRSFSEMEIRKGVKVDEDESEEDALVDVYGHGTHLAGVMAGELTAAKSPAVKDLRVKAMRGIAPRAKLLSVKIFSKTEVRAPEFVFLAALQWLLDVNKGSKPLIHGVLIGLGLNFDVRNYACGHSPVCEAANDLVRAGMVVVVPAGNGGYRESSTDGSVQILYSSITDPGNAELAITVGATDRVLPHEYGASYFSSKGPTMDGRHKPDLLAPGERITSCAAGREGTGTSSFSTYRDLDGTSIAAAHVAGASAALLSVKRELVGKPNKVKQIFLQTATDLGRTRETQGAGLLNLQKAITQKPARSPRPAEKVKLGTPLPVPQAEVREAPRFSEAAQRGSGDPSKPFVIAFSYPGKHYDYILKIVSSVRRAERLEKKQLFFAHYHRVELAQPNLPKKLIPVYFDQSEMVVVFLSSAYQESDWCGMEWRTILKRVRLEGSGERIMLLRMDHGEVKGLKKSDGYFDIADYDPDEVALMIRERLEIIRTRTK